MNEHTRRAKDWLDRRYRRDSSGQYLAHQPIAGLETACSEPNAVLRLARTYRLLELLDTLEFESVLDVGGGEGYLAALVRDLCRAKTVHSSDLSVEACQRAGEIFDIQGLAADTTRLPFADNSYDLVICSEVLEHLSRPVLAIGELARVARKFVVITTAEFCPAGETERALRSWTLDRSYPHAEINWFTARDFQVLLDSNIALGSQFHSAAHFLPDRNWTKEEMEQVLTSVTSATPLSVDHTGVIVIAPRNGADVPNGSARASAHTSRRILNRLLDPSPARVRPEAASASAVQDDAIVRLQCVLCRGAVAVDTTQSGLRCRECGHAYEVRNGIPVMIVDGVDDRLPRSSEQECVERLGRGDSAREQSIRGLMATLHNNELVRNGSRKQWIAAQLLRVLWFLHRDEPPTAKIARLVRQLMGDRSVRREELRTMLPASAEPPRI
jgi:ubiquinone/menaquinone biosynthesis C-methylase UbiE/uncharacterized protein YbaR (Trm112 family)